MKLWENPSSARLSPWRDFFVQLVRQGGPEPAAHGEFQAWLDQAAKAVNSGAVTAEEFQNLWASGGLATASRHTMQGFVRTKPHGYPGDFELIDRIYKTWISRNPALEKWDRFFQAQAAPRALRNSKAYFLAWLRQAESRWRAFPYPLSLLHLGGGPGRTLCEYFLANPDSRVIGTYLDPDARAIGYAAGTCLPVRFQVNFHQANPLAFIPAAAPHLIWSAGLLDYVDDENGISLLRRLWRLLRPGGELVAANFSPQNPTRAYMELMGWTVTDRTAEHLADLAHQAGLPDSAIRIGHEPERVILFLHLNKGLEPM